MPLFRRRHDPLEARSRELADKVKRLEREVRDVARIQPGSSPPRSVAAPDVPSGGDIPRPSPVPRGRVAPDRLAPSGPAAVPRVVGGPAPGPDPLVSPVGARKFDLPAAWRRWAARFDTRGGASPAASRYMTSNSIHGLRPLRYEKRVARNRFIGLFILLVLVLTGLARVYVVNMK
jgi:hypothetical protein